MYGDIRDIVIPAIIGLVVGFLIGWPIGARQFQVEPECSYTLTSTGTGWVLQDTMYVPCADEAARHRKLHRLVESQAGKIRQLMNREVTE